MIFFLQSSIALSDRTFEKGEREREREREEVPDLLEKNKVNHLCGQSLMQFVSS